MVDTVLTRLDSKGSIQNQLLSPSWDDTVCEKESFDAIKSLLPRRKKVKPPLIPIKHKRPLQPKYFTKRANINTASKVIEKPFGYPSDLQEFAYRVMNRAWRKDVEMDELKKSCAQKFNLKSAMTKDLLDRLHVDEPNRTSMKTIRELDSNFYDEVRGRPIIEKMDLRSYIDYNRALLRTKVIDGWRKDDIMIIEEQLILEQKIIKKIRDNFKVYVDTFEEFLMRDHTSALQLLKESDKATQQYFELYAELKYHKKKNSAALTAVFKSEDIWLSCRSYQQFLFTISPLTWKKENPLDGVVEMENSEDEQHVDIISQHVSAIISDANLMSLCKGVAEFKQISQMQTDPKIFFTSADELIEVFRYMEMQNLNSLLYSEELAGPLQMINDNMRNAEELFNAEIHHLEETIDGLEGGILWEEERASYLEKLGNNLIQQEFKQLVIDKDILNLHVFVEDVYETRIGPNDANLSMLEMMNAICQRYRYEIMSFDIVPSEQIALLEGNVYNEQMRVMRLAEKANRQNAEFERLTIALSKAFAPPYQRAPYKQTVARSELFVQRKIPVPPPRQLTEREEEFLEFFTDYCELTDDLRDYGIDVSKTSEQRQAHKDMTQSSLAPERGLSRFET